MDIETILNTLLENMNLLENKKKDLIIEAANKLEKAGMEPAKICLKLAEVLEGKTSAAYIREILPDKYKQASKVRTPKVLTDGTQEAEKEILNLKEQKDVKVGHEDKAWDVEVKALKDIQESKTEMEFVKGDKFISELKELEDKPETPPNDETQQIISKQDTQIRALVAKVNDLKEEIKLKNIEINELKGRLAMQSPFGSVK